MFSFALLCFAYANFTKSTAAGTCRFLRCLAWLCLCNNYEHNLSWHMLCFALLCFAFLCFALLCFALLCFERTLRNMLSCHVLSFALLCFALLRIAWHCFALLILCRFNCHHHPWSCTELRSESDNSVHKPGQGRDMKTHHGYWYRHFEHSNKQLEGSCHATPLIINF